MIDEQAHLAKLAQLSPEELTEANRQLLAVFEQQLKDLSELREEHARVFSKETGIAPSEIGTYLEKNFSPSELDHHRQQFEKEFGIFGETQDSAPTPANTSGTGRRPGPRRNTV
jgi:hypothetical protein